MNRSVVVLAVLVAGCGDGASPAASPEQGCTLLLGPAAFTQGTLTQTNTPTDLALSGPGFFMLAGHGAVAFTRNGHFSTDGAGHLLGPGQLRVQGFPAGDGAQTPVGDVVIGPAQAAPVPTRSVRLGGNLDANAPIQTFDPTSPQWTSNVSAVTTLYDGIGNQHTVDVYWSHTAAGTWEFHAMTDGFGLNGGTAGVSTEIATGTLDFDTTGHLVSAATSSTFDPAGATTPQPLSFVFQSRQFALTQFAGESQFFSVEQDGFPAGLLVSFSVDNRGGLVGTYTSGWQQVLSTLAIAAFPQPMGLTPVTHDLLLESASSGAPQVAAASSGGRGWVVWQALEDVPGVPHCTP